MTELRLAKDMDVGLDGDQVGDGVVISNGKGGKKQKRIVLIDHDDLFVHTLGKYLRQTGADVKTLRNVPNTLATIEKVI